MNYTEQLEELRKSLSIKENKQGLKHSINKKSPILPFPTRKPERAKFSQGFSGVTGEFARIVSGKSLNKQVNTDMVVKEITEKVNLERKDVPYFVRLVRMFLADDLKSMRVFHPHIFQYIPLTEGREGNGETNIAVFIRDVLMEDAKELKAFFAKEDANHLVAKLILSHLDFLSPNERPVRYRGMIPAVTNVFQEDIAYLVKHKEYFTEHIHLFLAYYYFFYITQLTLKLNKSKPAKGDSINEVIYTLDWEGASKSRSGYERGYQKIKDGGRNILVHINCLEHLNFLSGTHAKGYRELKEIFEELPEEEKNDFRHSLKTWIEEYRYHAMVPAENVEVDDYDTLVGYLYQSLNEGIGGETKSRYALSIEEVGKKYFLKTRGMLGYMLNVSQDFLLLMTAISVKDERKSLKEVFREFERRGVFFDRYSQESIVQLFDKLNILDKKSDSGDAQYVKPIL